MVKFVALLRGINGKDTTVLMKDLRNFFENLGFQNVKTVIASGNVIFETGIASQKSIEEKIEKAFPKKFGFETKAILFKMTDLQNLVRANPFKNVRISATMRPHVTLMKESYASKPNLPKKGKGYMILGIFDRAICYIIDLSSATTPDIMRLLEKEFGGNITTRSWNTISRITAL